MEQRRNSNRYLGSWLSHSKLHKLFMLKFWLISINTFQPTNSLFNYAMTQYTLDHDLVTLDYTNNLCKKIGLQVSSLSTYLDIVQRNLTQIQLNIMITMLQPSINLKSDNGGVRNSHVIKLQRKNTRITRVNKSSTRSDIALPRT